MKKVAARSISVHPLLLLALVPVLAFGAPFAERIPFTQPDGSQIVLWGEGDEFQAVFETLDGYSVLFNHRTRAYEFARLSADGNQLVSTGAAVGQGDPVALGLKPHLRINREAARKQAAERFALWDREVGLSQSWNELKAERRQAVLAAAQADAEAGIEPGVESGPILLEATTGQKFGMTVLVDFSDDVATVPQAQVVNFCNGDNYTNNGNNGSVKKYFYDVSGGLLTYSNVVTVYLRVPRPKTYYNDTDVGCGTCGRRLLTDALSTLMALPNYPTEILPTFNNLTVDKFDRVLACNVFFAGAGSSVWMYGLWQNQYNLASSTNLGNGKLVYKYQISPIGSAPKLGTFCHENGHVLLRLGDIYDYDGDSSGGAGAFCLMGHGSFSSNPAQLCAYLKLEAGWGTTVALTSASSLTASVSASGANFNRFYRYAKPGVTNEYYLVENRQKSGRDANLAASGIAIWHIDELGDRDNQSTSYNSSNLNYVVSLMQADNLWHFQNDVNNGDSKDLYYLGNTAADYSNAFNDATSPSARWWDGTASGIDFHSFSANGTTMTFAVGGNKPMLSGLETTTLNCPENRATNITATLAVTNPMGSTLAGATVSITSGFTNGQDVLFLMGSPPAGITTSYNGSTGVLRLSGTSSVANYQAALRNVVYVNTSDAPSTQTRKISFVVNNGTFDSTARTRSLAVLAVNDPPTLAPLPDITANEDAGPQTVTLSGVSAGQGESQSLMVTASSLNTALIRPPIVSYLSPNPTGTLTLTPVADADGSAVIRVVVLDNGGTANGGVNVFTSTFTVTLHPMNDAPSFTKGPDQNVSASAGPQSVSGWATAISPGPANESSQAVDFIVTNSNPGLFAVQPAVTAEGTLMYTPAADANGMATLSVAIHDDGGTAEGGVDTSPAQTAIVTVAESEPPPRIESISLTNGVVTIVWSAQTNGTYRVQCKTNLDDLNWTDLPPDVTADGPVASRTDEPGAGQRLYRVLVIE